MDSVPGPSTDRIRRRLDEAGGWVLAEDVHAGDDIPAFDRSTMDGYAVHSEAIRSAGPDSGVELKLVGDATAGQVRTRPLAKGEAFGVATGTMVPTGADAVVPGEYCRTTGPDGIAVLRTLPPGANILPRGSDLKIGQLALSAGTVLKPPHIGVLAALGKTAVAVYPRPVVSIIITGEELVDPDEHPGPGQIRDSNTHSLAAALERDGAIVRKSGIVSDDPGTLERLLEQELSQADLVLISGGSSVGKTDITRDALSALGTNIMFHGLKLRPGKPTLLGLCRGTVVAGLPGNPVSALAIYYVLIRPVLRKRAGWPDPLHEITTTAYLKQPIRRSPDREELARVRLYHANGRQWAEPVPGTSGMLHSMSLTDGQILITMDRMEYKAGDVVEVQLFD